MAFKSISRDTFYKLKRKQNFVVPSVGHYNPKYNSVNAMQPKGYLKLDVRNENKLKAIEIKKKI